MESSSGTRGVPTVDLAAARSVDQVRQGKELRELSSTRRPAWPGVRFQDSLVPVETVEREEAIDFDLSYRWANTFEDEGATYNNLILHAPVPRGRVWVNLLDHLNVPERVSAVVGYMGGCTSGVRRNVPTTQTEALTKWTRVEGGCSGSISSGRTTSRGATRP
mmetsp:Transcript_49632/g.117054  ORF Transcript_49632/g.117054 Transcript_49632/m.117054 type:complete len:163 (-) Transcript_49632:157-645(-)